MKQAAILALLVAFAWMHYGASHGAAHYVHMIHREVAFLPIILAAFWFGLRWGLAASLAASAIYAPLFLLGHDPMATPVAVLYQAAMFNVVAGVLGHLSDRRARQAEELMNAHGLALLGRAASTLGHEMKDLHRAMDLLLGQVEAGQPIRPEIRETLGRELDRLGRTADILASYVPGEEVELSSTDLNRTVASVVETHSREARKKGVRITVIPDPAGCPARTREESLRWVVGNVLENALEVTPAGKGVSVHTRRGTDSCDIIIRDQGHGISPENLSKIFSPFFTTRKDGHGITLAASRKVMRDMGGDLTVKSPESEGAAFTLQVPREKGLAKGA